MLLHQVPPVVFFFLHPAGSSARKRWYILSDEIIELIGLIHNLVYGNLIFAITRNPNSDISSKCENYMEFSEVEEICPLVLAQTNSITIIPVISDFLIVRLMKQNEFTRLEYNKRHHSGYLGKNQRIIFLIPFYSIIDCADSIVIPKETTKRFYQTCDNV